MANDLNTGHGGGTEKEVLLTYEGLKKIESELEYLRGPKKREVAERLKQAKAHGDLSENSEYDEARLESVQVEARIIEFETKLKNAHIIDEDEVSTEVVSIGSKVRLLDVEFKEEVEYRIVGSTEADPEQNKISNESPVGSALIGNKAGKTVDVQAPNGVLKFKILAISK
ncbi:MAG: transcription elongation factor GreA [Clostridiales bacterium]|jgi:transcription elongation factor GreA|nr:transcription elongation factor GreA [Clostridiales bacterium]